MRRNSGKRVRAPSEVPIGMWWCTACRCNHKREEFYPLDLANGRHVCKKVTTERARMRNRRLSRRPFHTLLSRTEQTARRYKIECRLSYEDVELLVKTWRIDEKWISGKRTELCSFVPFDKDKPLTLANAIPLTVAQVKEFRAGKELPPHYYRVLAKMRELDTSIRESARALAESADYDTPEENDGHTESADGADE